MWNLNYAYAQNSDTFKFDNQNYLKHPIIITTYLAIQMYKMYLMLVN